MLGSLEDTLQMAQEIPGVEPCLDFAHLHARPGDGSMNTYQEWRQVLTAYRDVLGQEALHRLHIHLSGIDYGPKGERKHLPLAEADIDLHALFRALHEFGCNGRILCESPEMEADALKMQTRWAEITA
jgi:deoxyribonuclease-4